MAGVRHSRTFSRVLYWRRGAIPPGASECYRKATLNPSYSEQDEALKAIIKLDEKALNGLKTVLEELEDKIFEATYGPSMVVIERNENNFDISYLRKKAAECMASHDAETTEDDDESSWAMDAYSYYLAALQIDPFDADCYADLAAWWLRFSDSDMAASYIETGLRLDPNNTRLASLANEIKEAVEE